MGQLRDSALLIELRRQTTLQGAIAVLSKVFAGGSLEEEQYVTRYSSSDGKPSRFRWGPYPRTSRCISLWYTTGMTSPSVAGSPCARVLAEFVSNKETVVSGNTMLMPVEQMVEADGITPPHIVCQRVRILE